MAMAERLGRTTKGQEEIGAPRKSLPAKLRTVLFLVEPDKDILEIQRRIALIGAPADALQQLVSGGYVARVGTSNAPVAGATDTVGAAGAVGAADPTVGPIADPNVDPVTAFRVAKAFMNETVVDALGIRAFMFTLKLERCATAADLVTLLPTYGEQLLKKLDREAARALVERCRELVAVAARK